MSDRLKMLERDGRVWFRNALNASDLETLDRACVTEKPYGERIRADSVQANRLSKNAILQCLIESLLPGAKQVRAVVFNKSKNTNWVVPWHQDRVIAVKEKHEAEGYKNWTKKSGIWHVEPPENILTNMVFVRIHLEEETKENGCMEIALGSHKFGTMAADEIAKIISSTRTEICSAQKGDVLIVKALMLHRSQSSSSDKMRRTLRVDYSNQKLPPPLQWAELK